VCDDARAGFAPDLARLFDEAVQPLLNGRRELVERFFERLRFERHVDGQRALRRQDLRFGREQRLTARVFRAVRFYRHQATDGGDLQIRDDVLAVKVRLVYFQLFELDVFFRHVASPSVVLVPSYSR
jgi:hypothetical protein